MQRAREAGDYQNKLLAETEKEQLDLVKGKGMKVIQPDVAAFRAATADVYRKFENVWGKGFFERDPRLRAGTRRSGAPAFDRAVIAALRRRDGGDHRRAAGHACSQVLLRYVSRRADRLGRRSSRSSSSPG